MGCKLCFFALILILSSFLMIGSMNVTALLTGDTITGKASNPLGMNISVISSFPTLILISPENKTYLTNESLLINYSVDSADTIKYSLDNAANITITSLTYINVSQGSHSLYLYANSGGTTTKNITFSVNSTRLVIYYTRWQGSDKGESTDFYKLPYEDLQNLTNLVLENTGSGKILFNQAINLTNDANPYDNLVDIDTNVIISNNKIEVLSNALPEFNKQATLWLYNLNFVTPNILKDGQDCPSSICVKESYIPGTLKFNVSGFTIYSAEESAVEQPISPSGGGGGGISAFSIDKDKINIKLKQGTTKKDEIIIKNTGKSAMDIIISSDIEEFVKISDMNFKLDAGDSRTIILDFLAREDVLPDLYMGKIIVDGGGIRKSILTAIEVESKKSLFDVKAEIPEKYLYIMPGEELLAKVTLYNLGEQGKIDVKLKYFIEDDSGNIIASDEETIAVETRASVLKTMIVPQDAEYGDYIFYVKVIYEGETASSSAWFSVVEKEIPLKLLNSQNIIISIVIIAIIFLLIILKRRKASPKKVSEKIAYSMANIENKPKVELYYD